MSHFAPGASIFSTPKNSTCFQVLSFNDSVCPLSSSLAFKARMIAKRDHCSSHHLFGCKKCMQIWMTFMQLLSFCQFSQHVLLWFNDWTKSTCSGFKGQICSQWAPPQCCQTFMRSKRLNKQLTQKVDFFTNDTGTACNGGGLPSDEPLKFKLCSMKKDSTEYCFMSLCNMQWVSTYEKMRYQNRVKMLFLRQDLWYVWVTYLIKYITVRESKCYESTTPRLATTSSVQK